VTRSELATWLTAADIFVTPYPNSDQIVSGTLAYAMSAGKACVSTRYAYAVEMLDGDRGRLVDSISPAVLADSLTELIEDRNLRQRLGRSAYEFSRTMIWPQVGARYTEIFDRVGVSAGRSHASREFGIEQAEAVRV
jgi:glycosyltransferase involved in cell wall biosynthesis